MRFKYGAAVESGFTLIELLLVIAVVGILLLPLGSSISSGYNFFIFSNKKSEVQGQVRFIANYIDKSVKNSSSLVLQTSPPASLSADEKAIGLENGQVKLYTPSQINGRNITSYKIKDLYFNFKASAGANQQDILEIKVAGNTGNTSYSLTANTLLNNITDKTDTSSTNYNFVVFKK